MSNGDNKRIPRIPIQGQVSHNAAFLVSIGNLVVNWANNESVFMAMLQVLIMGGKRSAAIVWFSHRTTRNRLELVKSLCRERIKDETLLNDIARAISRFNGFSKKRNFFCHGTYTYDNDLCLRSVSSVTNTQDGEPLIQEARQMDDAMLNEMMHATQEMAKFNQHLWGLVDRLQNELGVQLVSRPQQLLALTANLNDRHHPDKAGTPGEPQ